MIRSEALFSNTVLLSTAEVPMHLEELNHNSGWLIGSLLFLSLFVIALAKRFESPIFGSVTRLFFSLGTPYNMEKLEFDLKSNGSILLFINHLLSLWICLILVMHVFNFDEVTYVYGITFLIAVGVTLYQFVGIMILAWISGEFATLGAIVKQVLGTFQFLGLLWFIIGLIWFLNPSISTEMFYTFICSFCVVILLRFVKTFVTGLSQGISWYYIILYFCTLEILPILIVYYYSIGNFKLGTLN